MTIEVRTLVIKAMVQQDRSATSSAVSPASSGDNDSKPDEEMLNKCLEKIVETLKDRHER
jgi:hypothetical protein